MTENGKSPDHSTKRKSKDKRDKIIDELKNRGKIFLDQGMETAKDVYSEQKKVLKQKAGEIQDKSVEEISEDMKVYVRRNPLKSLAIALGIGAFLGFLFKSDD